MASTPLSLQEPEYNNLILTVYVLMTHNRWHTYQIWIRWETHTHTHTRLILLTNPHISEQNHPIWLCHLWFSYMSPRAGICKKTFDHPCHHRLNQWKKLGHVPTVPYWMEKKGDNGDSRGRNFTHKGWGFLGVVVVWLGVLWCICMRCLWVYSVCVCIMSHKLCLWVWVLQYDSSLAGVQQQQTATGCELWQTRLWLWQPDLLCHYH